LKLVVDSSVVLKWFVEEPQRELAAALLDGDDLLIAPDLVLCEVTNALWRKARKGEVTSLQATGAIREMDSNLTLRRVSPEMTESALQIAQEIGHSIYDCLFLACAFQEEAELFTADVKFIEKLTRRDFAMKVRQLSPA
jgi:predicted nucleic acid-binding protein